MFSFIPLLTSFFILSKMMAGIILFYSFWLLAFRYFISAVLQFVCNIRNHASKGAELGSKLCHHAPLCWLQRRKQLITWSHSLRALLLCWALPQWWQPEQWLEKSWNQRCREAGWGSAFALCRAFEWGASVFLLLRK